MGQLRCPRNRIQDLRQQLPELDWKATTDENDEWISFRKLEGRKPQFLKGSRGRLRARYLYFRYCRQILRLAWEVGAKAGGSLRSLEVISAAFTMLVFVIRSMAKSLIEVIFNDTGYS
jgi:hypothetical protein